MIGNEQRESSRIICFRSLVGVRSIHAKAEDALIYVAQRQQSKNDKPGATAGTIRRDFQVLTHLLNLAVRYDKVDKNPLTKARACPKPSSVRVLQSDELERIRTARGKGVHEDAMTEIWRAVIVWSQYRLTVRQSSIDQTDMDSQRA